VPNINSQERRKRLIAGIIQFAIALIILAVLIATGVDRWWRLPLLLFFMGGASGYFQWRDKT
jgi:fatty acid desaturase